MKYWAIDAHILLNVQKSYQLFWTNRSASDSFKLCHDNDEFSVIFCFEVWLARINGPHIGGHKQTVPLNSLKPQVTHL